MRFSPRPALGALALALLVVAAPTATAHAATPKAQLVRIPLGSAAALERLQGLGLDLNEDTSLKSIDAVVTKQRDLDVLARHGFSARVVIEDLAAYDAQQRARTRAYQRALAGAPSALPSGRSDYRMLEDYLAEMKKLATDFPALVKPVTLPKKTFQGRQVTGIEISSDVQRTDDQKPVAFVMGVHHAREWPSGEIALEHAYNLVQQFGTDPEITELLRRVRVVVVPIINPDGYVASRTATSPTDESGDPLGAPSTVEAAGAGGSLAYRRKNCRQEGSSPNVPCDVNNGIDPNRNYGFGWGGPGASTTPSSQSYRGPGPFSEAETQNVHEFSQNRDVTALLTIHNFASLVLRPPGLHNAGLTPDEARLKELGDAMAADTGYTSQFGFQLYDTSGTAEDWNYGAAGTYGYTIEMGPESTDGGNFHIDYKRGVVDQWTGTDERAGRGLRKALLRISEAAAIRADHSTLIGRAPAGRTLRLRKTFKTSTSPVCSIAQPSDVDPFDIGESLSGQDFGENPGDCVDPGDPILFDDGLTYTTRVPANGVFDWIVTPSTRPFEYKAGRREAWTLTCEDGGKVIETRQVTIWRNEVQSLDLPCGGPPLSPDSVPKTVAAASRLVLTDKLAPSSAIAAKSRKVSRTRISLKGSATDTAPAGLRARVAKVRIAIGRRSGKGCRFLNAEGRFGKKVSCLRTSYVVARVRGTGKSVRWTYSLGVRLPRGRYLAWSRAIDAAGNIERKAKARNLTRFTIR